MDAYFLITPMVYRQNFQKPFFMKRDPIKQLGSPQLFGLFSLPLQLESAEVFTDATADMSAVVPPFILS